MATDEIKVKELARDAHTFCKGGADWYRMDSVEDIGGNGFHASNENDHRSYYFYYSEVDLSKDKFYKLTEMS